MNLLHPARKHLHTRRYMTYLRLRSRALDLEFHVTNLHMVAGAFNGVDEPDQALRLEEWNEGIAMHRRFVEDLVETGLPVVGGGDYNRRLDRHRSLGTEIAGKPVTYAVDGASIDLLWFIDGDEAAWGIRSTKFFPGRTCEEPGTPQRPRHAAGHRHAHRHPHPHPDEDPDHLDQAEAPERPEPPRQPLREPSRPPSPPSKEDTMPGPFELTMFGDGQPQAGRLEDPRRTRGGGAPASAIRSRSCRAPTTRRRLRLGRHPRRRRRGRPARLGLAAQGPRAADGRLRGVVPATGPRSLGRAHPRRPDRPRQARAGRPPGR